MPKKITNFINIFIFALLIIMFSPIQWVYDKLKEAEEYVKEMDAL